MYTAGKKGEHVHAREAFFAVPYGNFLILLYNSYLLRGSFVILATYATTYSGSFSLEKGRK